MHPNDPDNVWPEGEEDAERDADMDASNEAHAGPPRLADERGYEVLREALEEILCCHDGNQPAALNKPDLAYARQTIRTIHVIARNALAKAKAR